MFNIGPMELLLILLVALIVVGPKRLPEVGRSIGRGLREIRKAQDEVKDTLTLSMRDEPARPAPKPAAPSRGTAPQRPSEPPAGPGGEAPVPPDASPDTSQRTGDPAEPSPEATE